MFHLYGLFIGVGVVLGLRISMLQARRWGVDPQLLEDAVAWIAIPAIVGARLYHVLTDWHLYQDAPFPAIIAIWNGGLGFFGALIGGLIGLALFALFKRQAYTSHSHAWFFSSTSGIFFLIADLLAFGAPLAQAIGRFGNYFNQELYGVETTLPWGMLINGKTYHPLFAYEAFATFLLCAGLNVLGRKKVLVVGKGQYACIYIVCYCLIRFWLEFLRLDSSRLSGFFALFTTAQWMTIILSVMMVCVFWLRRHADRGIPWELKTLL